MPVNYQFDKKRFEAFIDAIFAILLTILVLEIRIPEETREHGSTYEQVRAVLPFVVSYLASFMLIVGFWIDYHILFLNITHITKRFIILNMLFVVSISLAPFVTAFAGEHYNDPFAVALLAGTYFTMNLFFMFLYIYAKFKKMVDPAFWKENRATAIYSQIGIIAILTAIPLAYVNTYISFTLFIIFFGGHLMKKK